MILSIEAKVMIKNKIFCRILSLSFTTLWNMHIFTVDFRYNVRYQLKFFTNIFKKISFLAANQRLEIMYSTQLQYQPSPLKGSIRGMEQPFTNPLL